MGTARSADLIIIGGGPIGLSSALYAARAGLVPLVLEPRGGPVDKACGEGLMPSAVAALSDLGVDLPGLPFRGIRYLDGPRSVEASFRDGPGRGVRRTALHTALTDAVARAGIEVLPRAMARLTQDADTVRVGLAGRAGSEPSVTGRYAIAADGLHSPTRRVLGLDRPRRAPRRYGLRQHFRLRPWTDLVEVHWASALEAYVTPVAEDLVGVAVLGPAGQTWPECLRELPALRDRLVGAESMTGVRGAGPLRQRARSRRAGRVLLVGDAGGYVDALTGEGIAVGLAQAREAVAAIVADRPGAYPAAAARVSRRSAVLTSGLLAATRTATGRRVVLGASRRLPWAFDRVVNALAHN